MKKKVYTIILVIILTTKLAAQVHFFAEISGNLLTTPNTSNIITSTLPYSNPNYKLIQTVYSSESYIKSLGEDFKIGMEYKFTSKMSIETGLNLSYIPLKRTDLQATIYDLEPIEIGLFGDIPSTEASESKLNSHFYTFSIPINTFYHFNGNHFCIGGGISPSFTLISNLNSQAKNQFNKLGLAIQAEARYRIFEKIWLTGSFQHFLTSINSKENQQAGISRIELLKLGLHYNL